MSEDGHWISGGSRIYPELAAGGLWTTPSDLALWIIDIQNSLSGKAGHILTSELAKAMVSPVLDGYGLGVRVLDYDGVLSFNHDGSNAGYKAMYVGFAEGDGIVVTTNSDSGFGLIAEIIPTLADVYGWKGYAPELRHFAEVPIKARKELTGAFQAQDSYPFTISILAGKLQLSIAGGSPHSLLTSSAHTLFRTDNIMQIYFNDANGGFLILGSQKTPFHRM